jgi:hypothetical protein
MTQQLRAAGALSAAIAAVIVLGVPLMILLLLDPSSQAAGCGGTPTGPGPASVPGIPQNLLPIFEGAGQQFQLGNDGWAYLAALNNAESTFGTNNGPGTGVLSGSNSAGAAGPMQIGIGGAATDNWDTIDDQITPGLAGGAQPPSVYNEVDAVYGAAALLKKWGAPGSWQAALIAWNNYPPEIAQVTQLVAQYTQTGQGQGGATPVTPTSTTPVPTGGQGCVPVSGPTTPGALARVLPNGLAEIPQGARPAVQEMIAAGNQIIAYPYSYAGGHSPASMRVPPGPNADPGQQENGGPGYDCSSAVSFVLWGGGLGQSLLGGQVGDSWTLMGVGAPGAGQWVTIYAGTSGGQGHTFIEVAGIVLDTVHGSSTSPAGTGPRWQPASEIAYELSSGSFVTRHPPGL